MRAAPSQPKAAQRIARHMEGAGGVNMRAASSQRKAAQGIAWHRGAGLNIPLVPVVRPDPIAESRT